MGEPVEFLKLIHLHETCDNLSTTFDTVYICLSIVFDMVPKVFPVELLKLIHLHGTCKNLSTIIDTVYICLSIVFDMVPKVVPVELLKLSLLHGSLDSLHSVFLGGSFAFSVSVASCGTVPGFTSGPFKIWGSCVDKVGSLVFNGVSSMGEPVEFLKIDN